jgi:hypothetical protein
VGCTGTALPANLKEAVDCHANVHSQVHVEHVETAALISLLSIANSLLFKGK